MTLYAIFSAFFVFINVITLLYYSQEVAGFTLDWIEPFFLKKKQNFQLSIWNYYRLSWRSGVVFRNREAVESYDSTVK